MSEMFALSFGKGSSQTEFIPVFRLVLPSTSVSGMRFVETFGPLTPVICSVG